jgi:hypothetical protein
VRVVETTDQLREALGVEGERGALVMEVDRDGPAYDGGLRAGDVLTRVGGTPIDQASDILDALRERKPGEEVKVDYVRERRAETATVKLESGRQPRLRMGQRSFPLPGLAGDMRRHMQRLQEEMDNRLRELDERLKRLEKDEDGELSGT